MRLFNFRTIGTKIKVGYLFVIITLVAVISILMLITVSLNSTYNKILFTIIKANDIRDVMALYNNQMRSTSVLLSEKVEELRDVIGNFKL